MNLTKYNKPLQPSQETKKLSLDFGELVPGNDTNFEEVLTFLPVKDTPIQVNWRVIGDIASLVDHAKTEIFENQSFNIKFQLDKDTKPQTYTGYVIISVNGDFLSVKLPASVTVLEPAAEIQVLYRVILNGVQVMALSDLEKAIEVVRKAIESEEAQSGEVQLTDGECIFELPRIDVTNVNPAVELVEEDLQEPLTDLVSEAEPVTAAETTEEIVEEDLQEPSSVLEPESEPSISTERTEDLQEEVESEQAQSDTEEDVPCPDDIEEVNANSPTALPIANPDDSQGEFTPATTL